MHRFMHVIVVQYDLKQTKCFSPVMCKSCVQNLYLIISSTISKWASKIYRLLALLHTVLQFPFEMSAQPLLATIMSFNFVKSD